MAFSSASYPLGAIRSAGLIRPGESGRIMSPGHHAVAVAMFFAPAVVAVLPGLGLALAFVIRVKLLGRPLTPGWTLAGMGGLAGFIGGCWYLGRLGNLLPTLYLRQVARSTIALRPGSVVDPRDPDLVFVDVIPRANWGKAMLNEAADAGFLRVDPRDRMLYFERGPRALEDPVGEPGVDRGRDVSAGRGGRGAGVGGAARGRRPGPGGRDDLGGARGAGVGRASAAGQSPTPGRGDRASRPAPVRPRDRRLNARARKLE